MKTSRASTVWIVYVLACIGGVVSCGGSDNAVSQDDVYRAQAALEPFKRELKAALLEGLEDGPQGAILVCKSAAPAVAARRRTGGVEMGRTSHKVRNPDNAPAEWMKPLLAAYRAGTTDPHVAVALDDGRIGYVEPIYVQKPCLMCHGESIAAGVAEQIAAEYPDDQATGFREGDFRGLFWVTLPPGTEQQ